MALDERPNVSDLSDMRSTLRRIETALGIIAVLLAFILWRLWR
jgi:hypothetical protein